MFLLLSNSTSVFSSFSFESEFGTCLELCLRLVLKQNFPFLGLFFMIARIISSSLWFNSLGTTGTSWWSLATLLDIIIIGGAGGALQIIKSHKGLRYKIIITYICSTNINIKTITYSKKSNSQHHNTMQSYQNRNKSNSSHHKVTVVDSDISMVY